MGGGEDLSPPRANQTLKLPPWVAPAPAWVVRTPGWLRRGHKKSLLMACGVRCATGCSRSRRGSSHTPTSSPSSSGYSLVLQLAKAWPLKIAVVLVAGSSPSGNTTPSSSPSRGLPLNIRLLDSLGIRPRVGWPESLYTVWGYNLVAGGHHST